MLSSKRFVSVVLPLALANLAARSDLLAVERSAGRYQDATLERAWSAWRDGDVTDAGRLAEESPTGDERSHLQLLSSIAMGQYEDALEHYSSIDPSYERIQELNQPIVDTHLHLHRYQDALRFARMQEMPAATIARLKLRAERPLKVHLEALAIVPFAEHDLTAYFPAFTARLNGQETTAHVDTGGTFLHMGPKRAEKLGIEVIDAGTGFHGAQEVKLSVGIAERFKLGDAVLENVPVAVMPTLVGAQDFVIFGTNVLEPFFATLDYPAQRLILSPRGEEEQTRRHLELLPRNRVEVPFYLWGDHYMIARGSVGDNKRQNFFIDSGLVSLHPDGKGGMRQAALTTSKEQFREWGFREEEAALPVFESRLAVSLGTLEQEGLLFLPGKVTPTRFGGVRIDALLSHAFLSKYAWTIDFDRRRYIFSVSGDLPSPRT